MTTRSGAESPPSAAARKAHQTQDEATRVGHEATRAGSHLAQKAADQGRQVVAVEGDAQAKAGLDALLTELNVQFEVLRP